MIIKSLARKRPGFQQLIGYIGRDAGPTFSRNLFGAERAGQVAQAFEANHALLPKRKNGNALYHEVIVLPPQVGLSRAQQAQILQTLADRYCELRAPDNLAWGRIHQDTDNNHIHLMISANPAQSKTRTRLSKARFAEIQTAMEREARARFPELQLKAIYEREAAAPRKSSPVRQDAMERHSAKMSMADFYTQKIKELIPSCRSEQDLHDGLTRLDLQLYQRGSSQGVRDYGTGRRYRLKRLGLDSLVKEKMREWERARAAPEVAKPSKPQPAIYERAAELLRTRQAQAERAERLLRDFDHER